MWYHSLFHTVSLDRVAQVKLENSLVAEPRCVSVHEIAIFILPMNKLLLYIYASSDSQEAFQF